MKKIYLSALLVVLSLGTIQSQEINFGLTGGLVVGSANISIAGFDLGDISDDLKINDGAGFYLGLLADIGVSEKFSVQPELLYANIGGESAVMVPIMAKYYVADKLNIQAGPQLDFILDVPELVDAAIKKSGVSINFGAGYDIDDQFAVQAKYSVGLSNRFDNNLTDVLGDLGVIGALVNPELKTNTFQVGVVYKFN